MNRPDREFGRRPAGRRASTVARPGPARGHAAACILFFALAAIVRLLFLGGTIDRTLPFSLFYYGDSRLYREFALALMRGELFDEGIPFHPPLMAYALSWVIEIVGENPWMMRAWLAVAGATVVPLTYLLGIALWNRAVALTAAGLSTFSFGLCVAAVSANTETIYIPILVAQALAVVWLGNMLAAQPVAPGRDGRSSEGGAGELLPRGRPLALAAAAGILIGLGSLTRAEHLAFVILVPAALAMLWRKAPAKRLAGASAVAVAAAALVIAPWTLHNYRSLTRFNRENPALAEPLPVLVLVSNYGALNFALANSERSDGGFKPDLIVGDSGGDRIDFHDRRHLHLYLHGYREGLAFLAGNPAAAVRLAVRKMAITLEAESLGLGLSNWPGGLAGTRRAVDMITPDRKLLLPVSLALLAIGAWLSRSNWSRGGILWLSVAQKIIVCLAFFGYVRLFVQISPFLYLFKASALVALAGGLRWPAARRAAALGGVVLALLLLAELARGVARPRNFIASGTADPETGKLVQDAEMRLEPKP